MRKLLVWLGLVTLSVLGVEVLDDGLSFRYDLWRFSQPNESSILQYLSRCGAEEVADLALDWLTRYGQNSLVEHASHLTEGLYDWHWQLALKLYEDCPIGSEAEIELRERLVLLLCPHASGAVLNYAFVLEYSGYYQHAESLLREAVALGLQNAGLQLSLSLVSPLILESQSQSDRLLISIYSKLFHALLGCVLRGESGLRQTGNELDLIREWPQNHQYLGHPMGRVMELVTMYIDCAIPQLKQINPQLLIPEKAQDDERVIRLGVIPENPGNTSPGLCLHRVLVRLAEHRLIHIVFFDYPDLNTIFARDVKAVAKEVILIDESKLNEARRKVADASLDVLLFLSLPKLKFSLFLAQSRLARVQVQFGIGHPISSGALSMDYSIVSDLMLLPGQHRANGLTSSLTCAWMAYSCNVDGYEQIAAGLSLMEYCELPKDCFQRDSSGFYTEQVIRMSSLGHFIEDPWQLYVDEDEYKDKRLDLDGMMDYSRQVMNNFSQEEILLSCDDINRRLERLGLSSQLMAQQLGCRSRLTGQVFAQRSIHLYHVKQYVKKYHPAMDDLFIDIILQDPQARFLVSSGMMSILPRLMKRWTSRGNLSVDIDMLRSFFVFSPKIDHLDQLFLVALSSVFINPWPYGGGMTSAEALALCVPVVIWPAQSAVLNIALAQVRQLGEEVSEALQADSLYDVVDRAVRLAKNMTIRSLRKVDDGVDLSSIKRLICERRDRLFGEQVLREVTREWTNVLLAITNK